MKPTNPPVMLRLSMAAVILFGIIGCSEEKATQPDQERNASNMKKEINILIQSYESALNASDTAAVMNLYTSDPVFMPQHSVALEGRDAVKAGYEHVFSNIKLDVSFTVHEIEALGDLAYGRTTSAGKTRILAANTTVNEGNNEVFIFKKEHGQWKIHRYLFATSNPPVSN